MKIAIITFYTDNCSHYEKLSDISKKKYCEKHGYDYIVHNTPFNRRQPNWNKIEALLAHFDNYDMVVWMDADAIIANYDFDISTIFNDKDIYMSKDINGWNNGVFALKTNGVGMNFLLDANDNYEKFKNVMFIEQACMGYLIDNFYKNNTSVVDARIWNAYDDSYSSKLTNVFEDGDFVLHLHNEIALNRKRQNYRVLRFSEILRKNGDI